MSAEKVVSDIIMGIVNRPKPIFFCLNDRGLMLRVSRSGFETVRQALAEKKIFAQDRALPTDRGAEYFSAEFSNIIYVDLRQRAADPILFEANVLHECVHALFDIQGLSSLRSPTGEAAAYIVTAMVLKIRGYDIRSKVNAGGFRNILLAADDLVYGKKMLDAPGTMLDENDCKDLFEKVLTHYQALFGKDRYPADRTIPWPGVSGIAPRPAG
jgi:hypothetical protein